MAALVPTTGAAAAGKAPKKVAAKPTVAPTATKARAATSTPTNTPTSTATKQATASPTASPTATPTAAPSGSVGLGVYRPEFPNNLSVATSLQQASGKKLPILAWYALWGGWKSAFSQSDLDAAAANGSIPLITWEPWAGVNADPAWTLQKAILSGANDAYIDSWARGMAAYGKPLLLRFAHEMHNQSYPWAVGVNGNTAADYVAAWRHVHDIFARYNTSNVKWVWNPNTMGTTTASTYLPIYRSLYPGDAYVDWLGLDIYNTGPSLNWGAPFWRTFAQVLTEPYTAITAVSSKPLLLPEVGCAEIGGSKADWITDTLQVQLPSHFPRVRALVWFDVNKETDWRIDSSSTSLAAWIKGSQLPAYTTSTASLLA